MSNTDDTLEILQADVYAVLKNTPALATANVLLVDAETTDSKVESAIKTLVETGGKKGLAILVLLPEVVSVEKNLPGPPITVKIEIQAVEWVMVNRKSGEGTEIRSSQAAMNVLSVLQHCHLGTCALYADKDPLKPVGDMKPGYLSHSVTVYTQFLGLVTEKPLQVTWSITDDMITLACGTSGTTIRYTVDGTYPTPTNSTLYSTPFSAPAAGTLVRAVAYKTGMPPGAAAGFDIV